MSGFSNPFLHVHNVIGCRSHEAGRLWQTWWLPWHGIAFLGSQIRLRPFFVKDKLSCFLLLRKSWPATQLITNWEENPATFEVRIVYLWQPYIKIWISQWSLCSSIFHNLARESSNWSLDVSQLSWLSGTKLFVYVYNHVPWLQTHRQTP